MQKPLPIVKCDRRTDGTDEPMDGLIDRPTARCPRLKKGDSLTVESRSQRWTKIAKSVTKVRSEENYDLGKTRTTQVVDGWAGAENRKTVTL